MTDYFVIDRKRLIHHIDNDIRKSPRGVLNWMVDEKNVLVIFLTIQGVHYLYREAFKSKQDIPADISSVLTDQGSILGVIDFEEKRKKENRIKTFTPEQTLYNIPIGFLQ